MVLTVLVTRPFTHYTAMVTCPRSALLALLTLPLYAGVVDVSESETALVGAGDTLTFALSTWNYGRAATSYGLSLYPTDVSFVLVTAPLALPAQFTASLSSADASTAVAFDAPFGFTLGVLSSSSFQGDVSLLQGHLHLSSALSQDLFGGGSVRLNLQNTGVDVNLGLSPLAFRQDLFFSLSGGGMSVGAMPGAVTLESPEGLQLQFAGLSSFIEEVPEPESWRLLLGGGVLLCVVSTLLNRASRRRPRGL